MAGLNILNDVGDMDYEELSLTLEDDFSKIRDTLQWGTTGKSRNRPLKKVKIKNLDTKHILSILDLRYLGSKFRIVLEKELEFRKGAMSIIESFSKVNNELWSLYNSIY